MKKILLWLIVGMILVSFVSAVEFELNFSTPSPYRTSTTYSNIQVTSLKYEPYPVNPGEYVTLWIKAQNIGDQLTDNLTFELVPEFPFSLDSNEDPVRAYGQLNTEPIVLKYKVRTDKDAVKGTNEIKLRYNTGGKESAWIYKTFDIEVANAQTDFDTVLQELSGSTASIAIANTGENPAYSVIVRVPEQDYFQATGTNGQMVGNLANGDYTLVSFDIAKKPGQMNSGAANLKLQIDYTDTLGDRRSLIKEVSFVETNGLSGMNLTSRNLTRNGNGFPATTQTSIYQQWWLWAIIIAVLYVAWKSYSWYKRRKEHNEMKKAKK